MSRLRLIAGVLVIVLALTVAAPARAEADVFTILAIAAAGAAVVILVVYLVVASTRDSRTGEADAPRLVACVESDVMPGACWPAVEPRVNVPGPEAVQGP